MILTALLALFYRQAIGSQNELKIMTVGNTPPPAEAQGAHDGPKSEAFFKYSGVHRCSATVLQHKIHTNTIYTIMCNIGHQ